MDGQRTIQEAVDQRRHHIQLVLEREVPDVQQVSSAPVKSRRNGWTPLAGKILLLAPQTMSVYAPETNSLTEAAGFSGLAGVKLHQWDALCVDRKGLGDEGRGVVNRREVSTLIGTARS
jgi:hypothetical protein